MFEVDVKIHDGGGAGAGPTQVWGYDSIFKSGF